MTGDLYRLLDGAGQLLIAIGLFGLTHGAARVQSLPRIHLGPRGRARSRALVRSSLFAALEPAVRWTGALIAPVLPQHARRRLANLITRAGCPLGLAPEECLALCVVTSAPALALALSLRGLAPSPLLAAIAMLCALYPLLKLRSLAQQRMRYVARRLPGAIDLLSLCMGAGMDFVGALEMFVEEHAEHADALAEELRHVLQELSVGRMRREALFGLAERVPAEAVREFVGALVQAEQKGTPLADVLALQAQVLRMRRSVAAEEAAARASVMLLLPMLLLLGCVLLILLGPFIVNGVGL